MLTTRYWFTIIEPLFLVKTNNRENSPMSKIKNEKALVKAAIQVGAQYLHKRGYPQFLPQHSIDDKVLAIYNLLVEDKLLQPLAKDQQSIKNIKHKLAVWILKKLPKDHPAIKDN
jgi:hypothetical protein